MRRTRVLGIAAIVLATLALLPPATASAADDPTANEAAGFARERGISLAEAQQRLIWQIVAPDVAEQLEQSLPETFGGVWIDTRDGDRVKVGLAPKLDEASVAVVKKTAEGAGLTEFDMVAVPRSLATLTSGMTWLGEEIARVNPGARVKLAAGVRTSQNVLHLTLPRGTLSTAQADLVATAAKTFGEGLVIDGAAGAFIPYASCVYPYCDTPLRGGVKINYPTTWCSSAFTAQSKVDSVYYLITAGHCAENHYNTWSTKFTDLSVHNVGPVWHWEYNSAGDMAILRVSNPGGWTPKPWVQVTSGPDTTANDTYTISSDKLSVEGMRICVTGAAFGRTDCGYVTELDFTTDYGGGPTVHHLGRSSACGMGGDSGAAMYASHVAYGLMVGGNADDGCDTIYQGIRATETMLNVNVLHG
jgi:hypothetical protein